MSSTDKATKINSTASKDEARRQRAPCRRCGGGRGLSLLYSAVLISFLSQLGIITRVVAQPDPSQDTPLLFCQPNKMFVNITKSYLRRHNIEIKAASQLYFRGHTGCFAQEENNAYRGFWVKV